VTHYYSKLAVATVRLESGTLRVGDLIHIRGHTTDFRQCVESLEVDHAPATEVRPNDDFGLKVVEHARRARRLVQSAAIALLADRHEAAIGYSFGCAVPPRTGGNSDHKRPRFGLDRSA
jgi:translation elongation factor EF-1alpha